MENEIFTVSQELSDWNVGSHLYPQYTDFGPKSDLASYEFSNAANNNRDDLTACPQETNETQKTCDSTIPPNSNPYPCDDSFAGQFNFQLFIHPDNSDNKWVFSELLKKVFINMNRVLALRFRWNYQELKPDVQMFVRAMPVFSSYKDRMTPVIRCPVHRVSDNPTNIGFSWKDHILRCGHTDARYFFDELTGHRSCLFPLDVPQPGADTVTVTFRFVCKTSCPGGMDRKPIYVLFTLEDINGTVYGRQVLSVKICSCPKRDKIKEEKVNTRQFTTVPSNNTLTTLKSIPKLTSFVEILSNSNSLTTFKLEGVDGNLFHTILSGTHDALLGMSIRLNMPEISGLIHGVRSELSRIESESGGSN